MNIPCPLYPDPLEQSYRDQSYLVMSKARASYERKSRQRTKDLTRSSGPSTSTPSVQSRGPALSAAIGTLPYNPSLHLDTIAITEFISSYVPQSPYDYLTDIYSKEPSLLAPVQAASMAMTANKLKDIRLLAAARRLYATALSDTNIALRHPYTAVQDSTLVSVILLGLFEALACQISGISNNWAKHTAGAVSLLRLRGEVQFTSKLGRRLFDQICSVLCFDTMVRKVPMPSHLLDLVSTARILHFETAKTAFVELVAKIASSPCVLWDDDLQPEARVTKAIMLDRSLMQFTRDLPVDYQYEELLVSHEGPKSGWEAYGHTIHQYQHHHAARMWNACMVLRIKLQSVVHKTLSQLPPTEFPRPEDWMTALKQAEKEIAEAAAGICANVPQILSPVAYDKIGIEVSHEARVATLLPSLSVIKAEPLVPSAMRGYATDRLKHLGREFRVSQADSAATSNLGLDAIHSGFHMLYVY